jgi:hypothetical protein
MFTVSGYYATATYIPCIIFYTVNGCWILEDQGEIFNDNFISICKANVLNDCADKLLDSLSRNDAVVELCCGKVNEAYFRDQE